MVIYSHEALDRKLAAGSALQRADIEQAATEGAVQRLRPKLMTVAAVLASLVPILWETGVGSDVMKPIAAPIVGGMINVLILVHTFYFLDRDCTVVSVEARRENCQLFGESMQALEASGYSKASRWKLVQGDVESLNGAVTGTFDVVYCYGLLYHLEDPAAALSAMAARCLDLLLVETCVSFGGHDALNPVSELQSDPTQSFRGGGCRPTRPWIMNRLKALFAHVYVPRTQAAHEEFPLDWTGEQPSDCLTRATFVASRRPLVNEQLLDFLPERHTRC